MNISRSGRTFLGWCLRPPLGCIEKRLALTAKMVTELAPSIHIQMTPEAAKGGKRPPAASAAQRSSKTARQTEWTPSERNDNCMHAVGFGGAQLVLAHSQKDGSFGQAWSLWDNRSLGQTKVGSQRSGQGKFYSVTNSLKYVVCWLAQ